MNQNPNAAIGNVNVSGTPQFLAEVITSLAVGASSVKSMAVQNTAASILTTVPNWHVVVRSPGGELSACGTFEAMVSSMISDAKVFPFELHDLASCPVCAGETAAARVSVTSKYELSPAKLEAVTDALRYALSVIRNQGMADTPERVAYNKLGNAIATLTGLPFEEIDEE